MSVVALLNLIWNPKFSLPGIVTNCFDKIFESEMSVLVYDQEQEPNIPVIDLEKEVFDWTPTAIIRP